MSSGLFLMVGPDSTNTVRVKIINTVELFEILKVSFFEASQDQKYQDRLIDAIGDWELMHGEDGDPMTPNFM